MPSNGHAKILFIGDIMGGPGRDAVARHLSRVRARHDVDLVVANAENAAGGFGVTPKVADDLSDLGIDVMTSGNHIWDKKEVMPFLRETRSLLRPANFPAGAPGRGAGVFEGRGGVRVGVINLMGRLFMKDIDCPFRAGERLVNDLHQETPIVLIDFHAEATSEKQALAGFLDGRATAIVGTHTHVQTADEGVLRGGTAYITDVGMTGPHDSIIGVEKAQAIERFLTGLPNKFQVAARDVRFSAVVVTAETATGRAVAIERISEREGA
jgi:metallophosphoesterase (TIGR00282 family)